MSKKPEKFVSIAKMKTIDNSAIIYGIPIELMMENAGRGLAQIVENQKFISKSKRIVCIAGKGNNGGGVVAAARHLSCLGFKVVLVLLNPMDSCSIPSKFHLSLIRENSNIKKIALTKKSKFQIFNLIEKAECVVDGIFGTGFEGQIDEPKFSLIQKINQSKGWVLSNDLPSGVNGDTGKKGNISINPDFIGVLHKPKKWMKNVKPSPNFSIISLGIPPEIDI
ncbi:MAG: NAD(P)H-hydrate epimerase [Nitrosopumilaceae archaeon]